MDNKPRPLVLLLPLSFLLNFSSYSSPESSSPNEPINTTLVEEDVSLKTDVQNTYVKEKSDDQLPGDAAMLFHIPGLTLTENGGPLSSSAIRYRGLSNIRFPIYLEELSLNNPITGLSDANALFLFAAKNLQTNAQSLSITLPSIDSPQARGVFGYGSHHALKLGGMAGTPIAKNTSIFLALQSSSTNGSFSFSSPDLPIHDAKNNFTRTNNDQHRLQALAKLEHKSPTNTSHILLAFNGHEGGLPGYAFSSSKSLRNRVIFSGLSIGTRQKIKKNEISITIANSLFDYLSHEKSNPDNRLIASTHELTIGLKGLALPKWFDFELKEQFVIERAYHIDKTRFGGGIIMHRRMRWQGKLKPSSFANFSMLGFTEHGLIFKKDFGITIEPADFVSITGRFMRNQRLPTFMELYAKNSFFAGNPNLKRESIMDVELGSTFKIRQHTRIHITGFFGYLSDFIVDVPHLATMVRPVNVDTAQRYGFDVGFSSEPLSWLLLESKNSFMHSRIKSTEAPLPHAPPFSGLSKVRFGTEDFIALTLQARYKAASYASLFGTLRSPGYTVMDALFSVRFVDRILLSMSVSNIFNQKNLRDSYEMPLSGTVFFTQLEVGNI